MGIVFSCKDQFPDFPGGAKPHLIYGYRPDGSVRFLGVATPLRWGGWEAQVDDLAGANREFRARTLNEIRRDVRQHYRPYFGAA